MKYRGTRVNPKHFERGQIGFYIVLIPLAIFMVVPVIYILNHAFKPFDELFAYPPIFFVRRPTFQNFSDMFRFMGQTHTPMSRFLFNSLASSLLIVIFSVVLSLQAGYVLSKKTFSMKKTLFAINTISMMFVPIAVRIPRYLVIEWAGLLNTFSILVLPMLAMPVGLFLVKQFIDQVPDALIEAARIDGAKEFYIIVRIVAPIVKPALVTVAILAFQASWNSHEASTWFINDDNLRTFAFFMNALGTGAATEVAAQGMVAAASLMLFIPNLLIFVFMQSKIMNTMAHSGIK